MPIANINNHDMYYEIHGQGDPAICMGGWGTYCHGGERNLARGLTDRYQVLIIDYRGIGESTDETARVRLRITRSDFSSRSPTHCDRASGSSTFS